MSEGSVEGVSEGSVEGVSEGLVEGVGEGVGESSVEGVSEGSIEVGASQSNSRLKTRSEVGGKARSRPTRTLQAFSGDARPQSFIVVVRTLLAVDGRGRGPRRAVRTLMRAPGQNLGASSYPRPSLGMRRL